MNKVSEAQQTVYVKSLTNSLSEIAIQRNIHLKKLKEAVEKNDSKAIRYFAKLITGYNKD